MEYFDSLVGQSSVKERLSFYIDIERASGIWPHLLLEGQKGVGKTEFGRCVAKSTKRKLVVVNSATVRLHSMVESLFRPMLNERVIFLFDEAHALEPHQVCNAFLTILGGGGEPKTEYLHQGRVLEFDFKKIGFIFATTDPQKLFPPFRSRMRSITFSEYTEDDIAKILKLKSNVDFDDRALNVMVEWCRGNARTASQLGGQDVKGYCLLNNKNRIEVSDLKKLNRVIDAYPKGLNTQEVTILRKIAETDRVSLTALCSKTGLGRSAEQDFEKYLLKLGLIDIDCGKRFLTSKGDKYLAILNESKLYNKGD